MASRQEHRPTDLPIDVPEDDALQQAEPAYGTGGDDDRREEETLDTVRRRPVDAPEADALEQAEDLSAWEDDEDGAGR